MEWLYLTLYDCLSIHTTMISRYGGPSGVRDLGLLESAITQPQLCIYGEEIYPTVLEKASAYIFFIIKNHPFMDGNKRTGLVSALEFLERHGITIDENYETLYQFAIDIASSEIQIPEIVHYFKKHTVKHE